MRHPPSTCICFVLLLGCMPDADLADERTPGQGQPPPNVLPPSGGVSVTGPPQPPVTQPAATPAAKADDGMPPALGELIVSTEACVRAQVAVSKPATVHFVFAASGPQLRLEVARGTDGIAALQTPLGTLPRVTAGEVWVEAVDAQGRLASTAKMPFTTPGERPAVVISEVLANPAGSEYTQEYVELFNFGAVSIDLGGFTIEDGAAADALPPVPLPPGARALVVAEAFDAAVGPDPPLADALLLRVAGRIGRDGLSNAGESVVLRDPRGAVISRYDGIIDVSASTWNGRSVHRVPQENPCDDPTLWTDRPQPPTPGW